MEDNPHVPPQFQERLRNPHTMNGVDELPQDQANVQLYGFGP